MSDAVNINEILNKYEPQFMYMDNIDLKSNVCQSVFIDHTNSLHLTHQEIDDVCKATKGQSNNRNWILARTFLTSSNFALICKKKRYYTPRQPHQAFTFIQVTTSNCPKLASWTKI